MTTGSAPLPLPPPLSSSSISAGSAQRLLYGSTGQVAVDLDDTGCGFCYYESGRVAACANRVSDYQRRFQFYEDNARKTLLATIDEHAVGSIGRPRGKKMLLTKDGGMLMNGANEITKSWKWDPKAQNAGSPPEEPVVIPLNDAMLFTYKDRHNMSVKFSPGPAIAVVFDCGERLRRSDTYLDHAHRATEGPQRGKLLLDHAAPTLQQRQKQIELASIEKRSKQRPRSKDLQHEQIKTIVSRLEHSFDTYEGCKVTPAVDGNWRERAQARSLEEIPMLPKTGTEIGTEPTLYGSPVQPHDANPSLQRLKNPLNGEWLGSVELHEKIVQENPTLARSGPLTNASGRYSRELAVAGYVNGRKKPQMQRLRVLAAGSLDTFLRDSCAKDELVVVACLRADDPHSRSVELVLEHVQHILSEETSSSSPASSSSSSSSTAPPPSSVKRVKCRLVKCDLAESTALADRYRIHAAPTFLIFYDSRLVSVSSLGGLALRVFPSTKNAHLSNQIDQLPRVLLVEKDAKQQVAIEKILRKETFQWDLALSGEQAVGLFMRVPGKSAPGQVREAVAVTSGGPAPPTSGYGLIVMSDTLEDPEYRAIDRLVRSKDKAKAAEFLVCAVVSKPLTDVLFATTMCNECRRAQGRRVSAESASAKRPEAPVACPHCGIIASANKGTVVCPVLAEVAHVLVMKHVKSATLIRLAELWLARRQSPLVTATGAAAGAPAVASKDPAESSYTGLTVESFFRDMEKHQSAAKRGLFMPEHVVPAMALSAADVVLPVTAPSASTTTNVVVNLTRTFSA